MKSISVSLENCYGIRKLDHVFDFSADHAFALYAPNGAMKSSFANTFADVASGTASRDRIFPKRVTKREIKDQDGADLPKECVLVIRPYDDEFGHSERTSTLLVNAELRKEYEKLHADIDSAKAVLLKGLKEQSGSKKDIEKEVSLTFTKSDDQFNRALLRIKDELAAQKDAPYADVRYDTIFDDKVLSFLGTKDFKTAIEAYIRKYNELLAKSTYFKKGTFNYYNAGTIAKNLAENGFFSAKHTVSLNGDEKLEITSEKELEALIAKEKDGISNDADLKKKFAEIEKLITKNTNVRDFEAYLAAHEEILPKLANVEAFKEEIWKSYLKARIEGYTDLITKYQAAEQRKKEIELQASKERTQWEEVIEIFNSRFFVPFKVAAKNRVSVILGQEPILSLDFTFDDGVETAPVEKRELMQVLSMGERKALYILNIIFETETRKKAGQKTLLVVDDIADSFDYKNKYAIIQYLKDISEESVFYQIILTHNFDFFRTVSSRFLRYSRCLMVSKSAAGVTLSPAAGIKNVFINDWKPNFFSDPKKRVASIPFMRNLIEYTRGDGDPAYQELTSLLHRKADTDTICHDRLDAIYNGLFGTTGTSGADAKPVVELIHEHAMACLAAPEGINFENKIVLSIAIRLAVEKYMIDKIADPAFVASITANQTQPLLGKFRDKFPAEQATIATILRVVLMTPENIHLNSFMYEPILDMSDEHLRKLYRDVVALA